MSKRYQLPKEFGRNTKKPKLDHVPMAGTSTVPNLNALYVSPNNFWDDEDDDVILLATQVAEQRQEVVADVTANELTFSEFGANLQAATSTQRPPHSIDKILSQMLDDSDDDAFTNLELPNEKIFKKPSVPVPKPIVVKNNPTPAIALTSNPLMGETDVAARRQFALEQQMGYLSTHMTTLLAENKKLNQELISQKDSVISKSGEASLLRDELRHTKNLVQQLKIDRLKSREVVQSEAQDKIDQLNRTIETREAQLQMKSAECASLKMRHADETRRLDESMRNDMSIVQQPQNILQQPTTSAAAAIAAATLAAMEDEEEEDTRTKLHMKLASYEDQWLVQRQLAFTSALSMQASIYVPTAESAVLNPHSLVQTEFAELQLLLVQLMYYNDIIPNFEDLNIVEMRKNTPKEKKEDIKQQIMKGACKIFQVFSNYVQRLEYSKPLRFYAYFDYEFERDNLSDRRSILQPTELYANERAVNLRRYFAALTLACAQSPELAEALLLQRHDNGELLLKIASDAIEQMGYSCELNDHFGLLEAFAALLHILILQKPILTSISSMPSSMPEEEAQSLVELFKQLIFTRPSPWVFRELSAAFYEAMIRCRTLLDVGFCYNSPASSFTLKRDSAVYRFTPDSCVMQVYAGILHTLFPLDKDLNNEHFSMLVDLCYHYVQFIFRCFSLPPKFMINFVGNYDENPNNDSSPTTTKTSSNMENDNDQATTDVTCKCYVTMCLSALSLIYQVLYHWERKNKEFETLQVGKISQLSVQLLHIIFCENYMTGLLREMEPTTRHQFYMVCTWWTDNATLLKFGFIQMHFLGKLQKCHIMPGLLIEGRCIDKEEEKEKFNSFTNGILKEDDEIVISDADAVKEVFDNLCNPENFFKFMTGYTYKFE